MRCVGVPAAPPRAPPNAVGAAVVAWAGALAAVVEMGTTHTRGANVVSVGSAVPKNGNISLVTWALPNPSGRSR